MIKIYIDENFTPQLAKALNIFQEVLNRKEKRQYEVVSVSDEFGPGLPDEELIPKIGDEKGILITQNVKIQTTRHQYELYRKHKLGIFFFNPPSKGGFSFWDMAKQLVKRWDDIKSKIKSTKRPFAYRCTSTSKKFESLD